MDVKGSWYRCRWIPIQPTVCTWLSTEHQTEARLAQARSLWTVNGFNYLMDSSRLEVEAGGRDLGWREVERFDTDSWCLQQIDVDYSVPRQHERQSVIARGGRRRLERHAASQGQDWYLLKA